MALRWARALVATDPLVEDHHRDVIRLCALNGQVSAAERAYEACRAALADELDIEPGPETERLIERVRSEVSVVTSVEVPDHDDGEPLPLVGRGPERSALLGRVNEVVTGKGGVVLIEGEAGVGKSRLVEELIDGAAWRGVQVLVGRHGASTTLVPYGALREALVPVTRGLRGEHLASSVPAVWLAEAAAVLPDLERLVDGPVSRHQRPVDEQWRTAEALTRLILAQGRPKPTMLVLEDLHWADSDTMALLVQSAERLLETGVLVCCTFQKTEAERSTELWAALGELEASPGSSRHVIGPLAVEEIGELAAHELGPGRLTPVALERLTRLSAGNPYVVLELLRSGLDRFDDESLVPLESESGDGVGAVMARLEQILAGRVEALDPSTRRVVEGAAALGGTLPSKRVAAVVELDQARVVEALATAVDHGFLVETPAGCEFAQEATRRAVYAQIPATRRRLLHGRIVDILVAEELGGAEQLAHHAWLAEQWQRAYQYHSLAADSALSLNAFLAAAEHFRKADEAGRRSGLADDDRSDDLFAHERVLDVLGRRQEQEEVLERLDRVAGLGPAARLELAERWGWLLVNDDRVAEARSLVARATVEAASHDLGVGELLTVDGFALAWSGELEAAVDALRLAVDELAAGGRPTLTAEMMLGRNLADLGDFGAAIDILESVLDGAKAADDPRAQIEALSQLATVLFRDGNDVRAEAVFVEALTLSREVGYRRGEGLNLVNLASQYTIQGRGGRAFGLYAEAAEVFASLRNRRGQAFVRFNWSVLAHRILGDDAAAAEQANLAAVHFRATGDERLEVACLNVLASIDLRAGRRRLARRRLTEAMAKASAVGDRVIEAQAVVTAALVELDLGRHEAAAELAARGPGPRRPGPRRLRPGPDRDRGPRRCRPGLSRRGGRRGPAGGRAQPSRCRSGSPGGVVVCRRAGGGRSGRAGGRSGGAGRATLGSQSGGALR